MTRKDYANNKEMAERFRLASEDPGESVFWAGYLKGLAWCLNGKKAQAKGWSHSDWIAASMSTEKYLKMQGRGYLLGAAGKTFPQAIRALIQYEHVSAQGKRGGGTTSERKALTSAKNGQLGGRPKKEAIA